VRISVVTPCYNAEKYIEETIESVLSQRGDFEIEYLIMDGGSTDRTLDIIKKYAGWIEPGSFPVKCNKATFTYTSEKDEGMYDALAKGFRCVTGDIVAYVNSDDFYLPNAFSTVTEIFGKHPEVEWLTGMITSYNDRGQIIDCLLPFRFDRTFIQKGLCGTILPFIQQETTFWKRRLVNDLNLDLLKKYKFAGDFYMWDTFAKSTNLYIIHSCLGGFRSRAGQVSEQRDKYFEEFLSVADKRNMTDVLLAYLFKGVTYFAPNIIKRALSKNMICFDGNQWVKKVGGRRLLL
jgi:glycosyltransferase involved in cell wall biosynthesis